MSRGYKCGDRITGGWLPSISLFVRDDGGYTTVAIAVALLLSLTLVFSAASAEWAMARGAEVQEVADAAAMAGANCVAAFTTVAQVLDACVLSLGLAGTLVMGAGMVISAIPFARVKAPAVIEIGKKILETRKGFATSAASGLQKLESVLPALIMANSASCVSANCAGGLSYVGCAVPFPQTSQTDYSFLEKGPDPDEMEEAAEQLRDATEQKEKALERAKEAKERAWRADCIDDPLCMRSRAQTLAGLGGASNPHHPTVDTWTFGCARSRALNYYEARCRQEAPASSAPDELSRSAARTAFYQYALRVISESTCIEGDQVIIDLPELPHTSGMVRDCSLYTDALWPCTLDEMSVVLHSTLECPAATGEFLGVASLSQLEQGEVAYCDVCGMSVEVMGNVADASTNINNGFEHYWRIVVNASKDYQKAREEADQADSRMSELADKNASLFDQAMEALSVDRPSFKPAGCWGCVSVVVRGGGTPLPSELTNSFLSSGANLPPGAAISAATLAPDTNTDGNTVLSRVFDGLKDHWGAPVELVGSITDLWGRLLVNYGSGFDGVSGITSELLGGIGSLFGSKAAAWLKGKISSAVDAFGAEPADMRLRKPVLVRTQLVLDKAGLTTLSEARILIESMPSSPSELISFAWERIAGELGQGDFTVAELPIPGLDGASIPLTLDLSELVGAI